MFVSVFAVLPDGNEGLIRLNLNQICYMKDGVGVLSFNIAGRGKVTGPFVKATLSNGENLIINGTTETIEARI